MVTLRSSFTERRNQFRSGHINPSKLSWLVRNGKAWTPIHSKETFNMVIKQILTCIFFLHFLILHAQDRSFGTLPLVNKTSSSFVARSTTVEDTLLTQRIHRIYNRLVAARGDFRFPVPTLSLTHQERSVAWMDYNKMEITLEHKAIEVCKPYGDAAIAFLLGHELAHFYEKHAWRRGFVAEHKDLNIGKTLNEVTDDAANETEADYLGGFLAYSAGFGVFDKGPEIVAKLYEAYALPEELPGYPSLADRQELTLRSTEKMKKLVETFEMANYLTAIGRYSEAYTYYRYVLMDYQSREIYNNLGVTAVLDAMEYMNLPNPKFIYPLQIDLESMATRGAGMAVNPQHLLRQAILHFDAAISLDPDYAPAYLNKACAYALLEDYQRARFYAEVEAIGKSTDNAYQKTYSDAQILMGIILALNGDKTLAKLVLAKEASNGSVLAKINLNKLEGVDETISNRRPPLGPAERIDSLTMAKISNNIQVDDAFSQTLDKMIFHQNPKQGPGSQLLVNQNLLTEELVLFHMTNLDYKGKTSLDIQIGSDTKAIFDAYGEPKRMLQTPKGHILVYPSMLFVIGDGNRVERWATYKVQSSN